MIIDSRLKEPEYFDSYSVSYTDNSGKTREEHVEKEKNPQEK